MTEPMVWGVRAGAAGEADRLFLEHDLVALGWDDIGDLSLIPDREALKSVIRSAYPDKKAERSRLMPASCSGSRTSLQSATSSRTRPNVTSTFTSAPLWGTTSIPEPSRTPTATGDRFSGSLTFPERASARCPLRDRLSDDAIPSEELRRRISVVGEGRVPPETVAEDETVARVAEDIEQTTRDDVLKTLAKELKGHSFACTPRRSSS